MCQTILLDARKSQILNQFQPSFQILRVADSFLRNLHNPVALRFEQLSICYSICYSWKCTSVNIKFLRRSLVLSLACVGCDIAVHGNTCRCSWHCKPRSHENCARENSYYYYLLPIPLTALTFSLLRAHNPSLNFSWFYSLSMGSKTQGCHVCQ